ncbi:unnamed protein product [Schistocephalus solidus]|uniref:Protein kinase domain-containing protein n=1 Tax=Schistocephalus solidus TaxID=70667 RepID=A0A183SDA3_SCHSO|nr:unnamed protein product [Schistocephalus solidus]
MTDHGTPSNSTKLQFLPDITATYTTYYLGYRIGNLRDGQTKTSEAITLMTPATFPSRHRSCSSHPAWLGAVRSAMSKFMEVSRIRKDGEEATNYVVAESGVAAVATAAQRHTSAHIRYVRCMGMPPVQAREEQGSTGVEDKRSVVGRTKSDIFPSRRRARRLHSTKENLATTACNLLPPWRPETPEKNGQLQNPSTCTHSATHTSRETKSCDSNRPLSTPSSDTGLCSLQHSTYHLEAVRYAANITLEMAREATIEAAERARRESARTSRSTSANFNRRSRYQSQALQPSSQLFSDKGGLSSPNDDSSNDQHLLVPSRACRCSTEPSVQPSANCHEMRQQRQQHTSTRPHLVVRPNTLFQPRETHKTQSGYVLSTQRGQGCVGGSNRNEDGRDWAARRRSLLRRQACMSGGAPRRGLRSPGQLCAQQGHSFDSSGGGHKRTGAASDTRTDFERFGYQVVDVSRPSRDDIGRWRVIIKPEVFHRFNPRQASLRLRQNPRGNHFVSAACVAERKLGHYGEDKQKKDLTVLPIGLGAKFPNDAEPWMSNLKRNLCSSWPTGGIFSGNGESRSWRLCSYDFNIPFADIRFDKTIQKGNRKRIYKGYWFGDVTVHTFHKLNYQERRNFWEQVSKLSMTRHENIALFMGACMDPPRFAIVMRTDVLTPLFVPAISAPPIHSACHGPSLFEAIHICRNKLSYREGVRILRQLSQALSYLHGRAKNIVVKCLNSRNIFIEPKVVLSLLDYSSLECRTDRPGYLAVPVSNVRYTAPELLQAARASEVTYSSRVANSDSAYPDEATPSVRVTLTSTVIESEVTDCTEGSSVDLGFTPTDNKTDISSARPSSPRSLRGTSFLYSSGVSISSVFSSSPGSCSSSATSAAISANGSVTTSEWVPFKRPLYIDDIDLMYEQQAILSVTRWLGRRYSMSNLLETGHFYSKFTKIFPWNMARSNSLPQIASHCLSVSPPTREPVRSSGPSGTAVWSRRHRGTNQSFPALQMPAADEQAFRFPLILPEQCCTRATDIFALGTIIYEIFSGAYPMPATSASQYATYIIHGHRADLTTLKVPATIQNQAAFRAGHFVMHELAQWPATPSSRTIARPAPLTLTPKPVGFFPAATTRATVTTSGLNQAKVSGFVCVSTPAGSGSQIAKYAVVKLEQKNTQRPNPPRHTLQAARGTNQGDHAFSDICRVSGCASLPALDA